MRTFHRGDRFDSYITLGIGQRLIQRIVLEDKKGIEKRAKRSPQPRLQIGKCRMLVLSQLDTVRLESCEPFGQACAAIHVDEEWKAIDKQAHHFFDAMQFRRATGNGNAERYRRITGVAGEQDSPRSLHQGTECHLVVPCSRPKCVTQITRQNKTAEFVPDLDMLRTSEAQRRAQ